MAWSRSHLASTSIATYICLFRVLFPDEAFWLKILVRIFIHIEHNIVAFSV